MATPPEPSGTDFLWEILQEVNRPPTDEVAAILITDYLRLFAEKARVKPVLQKLYAKREILTWLMGQTAQLTNWSEAGVSETQGGIHKNYQSMQEAVQKEIDSIEMQKASTLSVMGQAVNVVPAPSPNYRFPANSPYLLGDPNYPRWRRR